MVLLEHTAGQGRTLGYRFEHLAAIIDHLDGSPRVGVCLDTCHLVASGYDIVERGGLSRRRSPPFERLVGLDRLRVFHANDSKRPCGSRVDRHEHIGEGCLGLEPFRRLLHDRRFAGLPLLIETEKSAGCDKPNTDRGRSARHEESRDASAAARLVTAPLKRIEAFSDGACLGNPGPGGYGAILRYGERSKELSGGFRKTTNNRMELTGAIRALEALKEPCAVTLFSDSEYVVNSVSKGWAVNWRLKGWRRKGGVVPNWDLVAATARSVRAARRDVPLGRRARRARGERALRRVSGRGRKERRVGDRPGLRATSVPRSPTSHDRHPPHRQPPSPHRRPPSGTADLRPRAAHDLRPRLRRPPSPPQPPSPRPPSPRCATSVPAATSVPGGGKLQRYAETAGRSV